MELEILFFFCLNSSPPFLIGFRISQPSVRAGERHRATSSPGSGPSPYDLLSQAGHGWQKRKGSAFPAQEDAHPRGRRAGVGGWEPRGKPGWGSMPSALHLGSLQTPTQPSHAPFLKAPHISLRKVALQMVYFIFREGFEPPA